MSALPCATNGRDKLSQPTLFDELARLNVGLDSSERAQNMRMIDARCRNSVFSHLASWMSAVGLSSVLAG
jgi:hypothetical protein